MKTEIIETILNIQKIGCLCLECKETVSNEVLEAFVQRKKTFGLITFKDHLYERMKVSQYLHFFASLKQHERLYQEAIQRMKLEDVEHVRIKKLNDAQKFRCALAREMIKDEALLYIQEPLWNLDDDSISVTLQWLESLQSTSKQVILTSQSFKDICLLPGRRFTLHSDFTLEEINTVFNPVDEVRQPMKLSARMKDKTLLFNPKEIDYIESIEGKSYLNVRNSSFQCSETLEELETKLTRYGFYRSHRSYLVNMQKIEEIVKWTRNSYSIKVEGNEARIPLSKGRAEGMRTIYDF